RLECNDLPFTASRLSRSARALCHAFCGEQDRGKVFGNLDRRVRDVAGKAGACPTIAVAHRADPTIEEQNGGERGVPRGIDTTQNDRPQRRSTVRLHMRGKDVRQSVENRRLQKVSDELAPADWGWRAAINNRA